jgi:hypothetical protein
MPKTIKNLLLLFAISGLLLAVLWGPIVTALVEHPKYNVLKKEGPIEIRHYQRMITAETHNIQGDQPTAVHTGFKTLASYIFGQNTKQTKIDMTAPVMQEYSNGVWKIRFVMPSKYTMDTLPKPTNSLIRLHTVPEQRVIVIRFAGLGTQDNLEKNTNRLLAFLKHKDLTPIGNPIYAFFNPPWTLPFLRRNEVMIEIER